MKLFLIVVLFSSQVFAHSLKSLAQTSNMVLVLADRLAAGEKASSKTCGFSNADISGLSQSLKSEVDAKILSLTDADYKIIQSRVSTCHLDCTCDIYSLALEKKEIKNADLSEKASRITMKQRAQCVARTAGLCSNAILKSLK